MAHLAPHDVAIYDLGADTGRDDHTELERLVAEGVPVVGLARRQQAGGDALDPHQTASVP